MTRQAILLALLLLAMTFLPGHAQSNFTLPKVARSQQRVESATPKSRQQAVHKEKASESKPPREDKVKKATPSFEQMNDYELELKASSGSVEAQYALGRRWVLRGDSVSVAKGVNWLKVAAAHGSQQARNLLRSVND